MKVVMSIVCVVFLFAGSCFAASTVSEFEQQGMLTNEQKRAGFVIEEAGKTIANNKQMLALMYKKAGADTVWFQVIGEQLPYQTIAVIQLMALADVPVEKMCPRVPYRKPYSNMIEEWLKPAITSLSAFTMNNPKEEAIRKVCLERNQAALKVIEDEKAIAGRYK